MLKNTLTILRGTAIAQALGFVALPLLARLFQPEEFGSLQAYQATLGLILVLAAMRFEIALLRSADGDEFRLNLQVCALLHVASTVLTALLVWLLLAATDIVSEDTASWLAWLPAGVLVAGVGQTLGYVLLRRQEFGATSNAKVAQSLAYVGASVGNGMAGWTTVGLVVGDIVGRLALISWMFRFSGLFSSAGPGWLKKQSLMAFCRKFREYPLVAVPGGLINAAGGGMTGVLVYSVFDAAMAGQYGLVERSILMPIGMVGAAISQAYTASLAARLRSGVGQVRLEFDTLVKRMLMLGAAPALIAAAAGPQVFQMAFGPTWRDAGFFAQLMSPWIFVTLASTAANMTIMVVGDQRTQLAWEITRLLLVVSVWLVIGTQQLSIETALILHSAANVVMAFGYLLLARRCADAYDRKLMEGE